MKILVVSGSSRAQSLNTRLAHLVGQVRPTDDVTTITDLRDIPFYDGDLELAGTPPTVARLRDEVTAADVVVFVTPEYNGTVPGLLANAVDWLSRPSRGSALRGKRAVVLSASPTRYGGARAAEHLRGVLTHIGAVIVPTGVSVPAAHEHLADAESDPLIVAELDAFLAENLHPADDSISV